LAPNYILVRKPWALIGCAFLKKLNLSTNVELARYAIQHQLAD
jgi:hypothetical protein